MAEVHISNSWCHLIVCLGLCMEGRVCLSDFSLGHFKFKLHRFVLNVGGSKEEMRVVGRSRKTFGWELVERRCCSKGAVCEKKPQSLLFEALINCA